MKRIFPVLFAIAVMAMSCDKSDDQDGVFEGTKVTLYNGKAWTWAELDEDGNPLRSAIVIDDAALNSLPVGGTHPAHMASLPFNSRASKLPFMHAALDWNPIGHPPEMIYGKAHFDFHFYTISEAERMAIPEYTAAAGKFDAAPPAAYLPANYINPGGGVPMMGAHWLDATSSELSQTNPKPFGETFVYGSYDGKVIFYEPMITLDFLKATTNFERTIPQPTKWQVSGYYPTKMQVKRHDGITEIILDGFVARQAS